MTITETGDNWITRFSVDWSRPGFTLTVDCSSDLTTWSPLAASMTADQFGIETWEAAIPSATPAQFVRLRAVATAP